MESKPALENEMESNSEMDRCLRMGLSAHGELERGELEVSLASLGCNKGGERVVEEMDVGDVLGVSRSGDGVWRGGGAQSAAVCKGPYSQVTSESLSLCARDISNRGKSEE